MRAILAREGLGGRFHRKAHEISDGGIAIPSAPFIATQALGRYSGHDYVHNFGQNIFNHFKFNKLTGQKAGQ